MPKVTMILEIIVIEATFEKNQSFSNIKSKNYSKNCAKSKKKNPAKSYGTLTINE